MSKRISHCILSFFLIFAAVAYSLPAMCAQPTDEGIVFDGCDGYQVNVQSLSINPNDFSVVCWVKYKETVRSQMFVSINVPGKDFSLYIYNDKVRMLVEQDEMSYHYTLAPIPPKDKWVHLAGTYDGKTIRYYVNGKLTGAQDAFGQRKTFTSLLYLGCTEDPKRTLDGSLEDIRLYNAVLSEEQIGAIYSDGSDPTPSALISRWTKQKNNKNELVNLVAGKPNAIAYHPKANALLNVKDDGFRSIWYYNQASGDKYVYKYSGGLGTYPANHYPFSVYRPEVDKTFFCYGGTDKTGTTLLHEVSYFDHKTGLVARPTIIIDKKTDDAHDNPVMTMDDAGYIWIFSTSHGTGRPSFVHKSVRPYDIREFELVPVTKILNKKEVPMNNFSYVQVFNVPQEGLISLFTTYDKSLLHDPTSYAARILCFMKSRDGIHWSTWDPLAAIQFGHYQNGAIYKKDGIYKIGTAFNYHPRDPEHGRMGLNWRTNVYYMESLDGGLTWQSADGQKLEIPIKEVQNDALAVDYDTSRKNVYILDLIFDENGYPVVFYIVSNGYRSGPEAGPREWFTCRWTGKTWEVSSKITESDNNYDFGSLYIDSDGVWRMIGTDGMGPQEYNTGGEVSLWTSLDKGKTWTKTRQMTDHSAINHCYPRRGINVHDDFYAFWADGHGRQKSEANLYFSNKKGDVFRLPRQIPEGVDMVKPELIPVK